MNAIDIEQAGTKATTDVRRWSRLLAALVIPVGPAAVALLRYVLPYDTVDGAADMVAAVVADRAAQSLVLWLSLVVALTLVPGAIWVGRLTRRHAPRSSALALVLLVPGYLALTWMAGPDLLVWAGATAGVDPVVLAELVETTHPASDVTALIFVLGHVAGTVLLGIAMWLSRAVPRWAALATIVSQPLHLVAAVIVVSHPLDLAAWGLQAAAFAAAAFAIVRLPDDEWELPPLSGGVRG